MFITQEDVENLKAKDARWQAIETAIQVDKELRDSVALNLIMEAATRRANEAREGLVDVNPSDLQTIIGLQADVKCARFIANTLLAIRSQGLQAQASLEDEGRVELDREEDGEEKEN